MRRRWGFVVGLAVALPLAVVPSTGAAPTGVDALKVDLDDILADPRLGGVQAGVVVRDPATDEILYSRQATDRATPASNAKLFTAAAALEVLGPDYRFRTQVLSDAAQQGATLDGDLYLRGTGDPTMLAADYDALAARLAEQGVREVRGRLLADDTWFDDVPLGSGWAWDDEPYYYSAPVSALTVAPNTDFDAGSAIVRVTPTAPGQPPDVALDPATGVLDVDNRASTVAEGEPDVTVTRDHRSGRVVVTGTVPAGADPVQEWIAVPDATAYATDVFARALAAHGITVSGTGEAAAPQGARELAARDSMPLRELLVPFLKLSNNGHAEVLVKAMGRERAGEGSWEAGTGVVADALRGLGVDSDALRLVDGSGLSRMDGVTPDQLALLLDNAAQRPWAQPFTDALPVAGVAGRMVGGTLRNRMTDTPAAGNVHAKTGSLTGVTSLSGYVTAADGRGLVFSVVLNDFLSDAPQDLEDAIAVRLAQHTGADDQPRGHARIPQPRSVRDDPGTPRDEGALECSWTKSC
ncbi:D-alanyl-D-alanine carboxypeptidase/D-alanyl-D-alanine endopeptidase [Saccharopolyspora flava]|uniref:D-alanyl-D-alanine carboxypeptidase / D-alanyl-D-alanine-endopeptidase (Penicillin-binding protein 4) n=1 Tax=Saccharopolyspora flava TaxID=95161 RepID=A0A1I6NY78_9PSEU|nr:D-alanyl-D-alanine carboxypeptidase/D-alanyl-D-alanine-endopeptidase [Saccharopolyspora flava]SFS32884.1 D-alanyl-D-alanine carboxypeptidase / D-alanyl-D-alanine-endopeptidase (penicillin-binding protein 4) [Saccharopolyspora flava]